MLKEPLDADMPTGSTCPLPSAKRRRSFPAGRLAGWALLLGTCAVAGWGFATWMGEGSSGGIGALVGLAAGWFGLIAWRSSCST
jgi:hypothetical protein